MAGFRSQLKDGKTRAGALLLIALYVLSISIVFSFTCIFFRFPLSEQELGYVSEYWYGSAQVVGYLLLVALLLFHFIRQRKGLAWEKLLSARVFRIVGTLLLLFGLVIGIVMSMNYDVIRLEDGRYTFSAHRVGADPRVYTVEDVVAMHVRNDAKMSLQMTDGRSVYLVCGLERESDAYVAACQHGQAAYEVCRLLVERGVPICSAHKAAIERSIRKYSARYDSALWQIYLPYIASQLGEQESGE